MLNDDRRSIDESYASAGTSSNLKVDINRRGDVDVLISAGLSPHIVGGQLLRLRTEWDCASHNRPAVWADFLGHASNRPGDTQKAPQTAGDVKTKAVELARLHNIQQTKLLMANLKSYAGARTMLANQLTFWGAQDAETTAVAVLRWWLNPVCHECNGTKYEAVPNTGRLSAKACKCCQGAGLAKVPHGQIGRRLANWIDTCLMHSRQSISKRLRNR